MTDFVMPSLGADMDEGTVIEWLVKPGDVVERGDLVAVVDTAKAAIEVECFTAGKVRELLVPAGTKVPVGTALATIDTGEEALEPPERKEPAPATGPPPAPAHTTEIDLASPPARVFAARTGVDLKTVHGTGRDGRVTHGDIERALPKPAAHGRTPISPYARRLARELGVDPVTLAPTAPDGIIRAKDVRAAHPAPSLPRPSRHTLDPDALRQAVAALMSRSKREIPHYYLTSTIDLFAATEWLREHNLRVPVTERLVPAALLLKATALAAAAVPELNGHWTDDGFRPGESVKLGVAVALRGGGLVTPAISGADRLTLPETMASLRDLVSRVRTGTLRAGELTAGTITVTDLGDNGVESVHGVIYPPQVALVGFGAISRRPWAVDGLLGVRPLVTATLAGDHRATDGATGARFLKTVNTLLQSPEEL
ncbi:dihydrolipoamide acetyltransferase family protein [Amycolatopsis orientalis]|uniref:dihydrolipoamide acetyltransferase family protein n=1 Tax=Amycolatopsis orientalis TaxID=31958 RepID=UPI00041F14D3|nr:dihydrolipoamide acetyltransferase family protein [Amycolatopsis orientalis]